MRHCTTLVLARPRRRGVVLVSVSREIYGRISFTVFVTLGRLIYGRPGVLARGTTTTQRFAVSRVKRAHYTQSRATFSLLTRNVTADYLATSNFQFDTSTNRARAVGHRNERVEFRVSY